MAELSADEFFKLYPDATKTEALAELYLKSPGARIEYIYDQPYVELIKSSAHGQPLPFFGPENNPILIRTIDISNDDQKDLSESDKSDDLDSEYSEELSIVPAPDIEVATTDYEDNSSPRSRVLPIQIQDSKHLNIFMVLYFIYIIIKTPLIYLGYNILTNKKINILYIFLMSFIGLCLFLLFFILYYKLKINIYKAFLINIILGFILYSILFFFYEDKNIKKYLNYIWILLINMFPLEIILEYFIKK